MLRCPNCSAPVESNHRFCGDCGAKIEFSSSETERDGAHTSASTDQAAASTETPSSATPGNDSSSRYVVAALIFAVLLIGGLLALNLNKQSPQTSSKSPPPTRTTASQPPAQTASRTTDTPTNHRTPDTQAPGGRTTNTPGTSNTGPQGVVGQLEDQRATSRICRKNGRCLPGAGTNIETGDTIEAPTLAVLYIEDPGGYSKHGLTGKITNTQISKLSDGSVALDLTLVSGKMEGTIRRLYHVIRLGPVYCLARGVNYAAEVSRYRVSFKIETGVGLCFEGNRRYRVDARNPIVRIRRR